MKKASWFLALLVGVIIGIAATRMLTGGGAPPPTTAAAGGQARDRTAVPARGPEDPAAVYRVPVDDSPVKGPPGAPLTIVISSDFQCPFCKRVLPTLERIEKAYAGKVRFAFKHNPLGFHDKALPAALAAEEARAQGGNEKFWAMHDALFAATSLDRPALEEAAQKVGLDVAAFRRALDEQRHLQRVKRDQALVIELGATGTPTFFVNGRKLVGALPFEAFKPTLDEELARAEAALRSGVPAAQLYGHLVEKGATAPVYLPPGAAGAPPRAHAPAAPPPSQAAKVPLREDDPSRGPESAKVTVVVFSDFECPFCSKVEPTMKRIEQAWPGQVRVVWKHQPLAFHRNAVPAAIAAEAARAQGKFWQMHDKLFEGQRSLAPEQYERWAKEIGLDVERFRRDVAQGAGRDRVEADQQLAAQVGAQGTPTLFLNCRKVVGALPFESFQPIVQEEIGKADALVAKGARPGASLYERLCDENVSALGATQPVAQRAPAAAPIDAAAVDREIRPDDPVRGNAGAPLTMVVFSDFQCPFCSRAVPTLKQIESTYKNDVRIVWKHQPLPFHSNAMPAALAAEAARQQGKFWEMHDKLFENQRDLSTQNLERLARELKLDLGKYRAAIQDPKLRERVEQDQRLASKLGASGTPTFVIGGEKLVGALPFESFKAVIDRQLATAKKR